MPGLVRDGRGQRPRLAFTSRAERTEGGWRLYGAKTWTTRGTFSHKTFGLFRTDPESAAPQAASPTSWWTSNAEGINGAARSTSSTAMRAFAEVYYDGVFVPDERRARRGGQAAGTSPWRPPGPERGLTLRSPGRFMAPWPNRGWWSWRSATPETTCDALHRRRRGRWLDAKPRPSGSSGWWTASGAFGDGDRRGPRVEHHEAPLVATSTSTSTRPRSTSSAAAPSGWPRPTMTPPSTADVG